PPQRNRQRPGFLLRGLRPPVDATAAQDLAGTVEDLPAICCPIERRPLISRDGREEEAPIGKCDADRAEVDPLRTRVGDAAVDDPGSGRAGTSRAGEARSLVVIALLDVLYLVVAADVRRGSAVERRDEAVAGCVERDGNERRRSGLDDGSRTSDID